MGGPFGWSGCLPKCQCLVPFAVRYPKMVSGICTIIQWQGKKHLMVIDVALLRPAGHLKVAQEILDKR